MRNPEVGETAPTPRSLEPGEIHVWSVPVPSPLPSLDPLSRLLSRSELDRASRFVRSGDRDRFLVRRGLRRSVLSEYLGIPPADLRFAIGRAGKPTVEDPAGTQIGFSASSSAEMMVLALCRGYRIGVDIERERLIPNLHRLSERVLTNRERGTFSFSGPDGGSAGFLAYWTLKEAYVKATGAGLGTDLRGVEFTDPSRGSVRLRKVNGTGAGLGDWTTRQLHLARGFASSLVVEGPVRKVRVIRGWPSGRERPAVGGPVPAHSDRDGK